MHVHNTALLAQDDQVVSVQADIRQPEAILDHPDVARLIDFGQPVGVLCVAVLHLVPDAEDPEIIVARFRILRFFDGFSLVPPGLADVEKWRQDGAAPTRLKIAGAVGRKP